MAGIDWIDDETFLEDNLRKYARENQDRFTHLSSPASLNLKYAAEGTKISDDRTVSSGFACLNHARASVAPIPTCHKTCPVCVKHFRPLFWQEAIPVLRYKDQHSDAEAASIIAGLVQMTRDNLAHIRQSVQTSGNVLAKRWQKRNASKRAVLLRAAMPSIRRRTDRFMIQDFRGKELSTMKSQISLPYLNADVLSEDPMSLLALLHYRSTACMADWVMFDGMHIAPGFSQGALEASYNPHCVVLSGEDVDVGHLVFWNKDEAHRSQIIGYPLAKMILESQSIMSTFLADMVNSLLQSPIEAASKGCDLWNAMVAVDFVDNNSDQTSPVIRQPEFRAAPAHHFAMLTRMLHKIQARHAASRSDTWLLQTDPAFTRQALATMERSGVLSSDAKKRPAMISLLLSSASRQTAWYILEQDANAALQVFELEDSVLKHDQDLPWKCAAGLRTLEQSLKQEFRWTLAAARTVSMQTGVFGPSFNPRSYHQPFSAQKIKAGKDIAAFALGHMRLHDCSDHPLPSLYINLLEHEIASAKGERRFNQTLCEHVADLSALDEAITAIRLCRPGHNSVTQADLDTYKEGLPHWYDFGYASHVEGGLQKNVDRLWPTLQAFLSTTVHSGKANRAGLAALDASHAALKAFWDAARALRKELLVEAECPEERMESLMAVVEAGLSPEYAEELQNERRMLLAEIERIEEAAERRTPRRQVVSPGVLPAHDFGSRRHARTSTPLPLQVEAISAVTASPQSHGKVKIKTRPEVTTQVLEDQANDDNAVPVDDDTTTADVRISVSPTSMDIFRRMFVSFGKHSNSNLRWGEFVKAMDDAGFEATWSTGGSAVVFDGGAQGAIRLHQPHPDPSINPIMLRSFGKRMFRQFGWSIDTFVERA